MRPFLWLKILLAALALGAVAQPAAARPGVGEAVECMWQALPQARRDSFLALPAGPANSGYFSDEEQFAALDSCSVREEIVGDVGGAFAGLLEQRRAEAQFARRGVTLEQLDAAWGRLDPAKPMAMTAAILQGDRATALKLRDELLLTLGLALRVRGDALQEVATYLAGRAMREFYEQKT